MADKTQAILAAATGGGGTSTSRSHAETIVHLFEHVVSPAILCSETGTVNMPSQFTINMKGSTRLYTLLSSPALFCILPQLLQKGILDVLHLVMIRGTYDVIRFQCHGEESDTPRTPGLTRILLTLLQHCQQQQTQQQSSQSPSQYHANTLIKKRIVHLLGLTSAAGVSTSDLRDLLVLLRYPGELTLSLLQALGTMVRHDNAIVKAAPPSFFNLGGHGAGLESTRGPFPFNKEYQFFTWFRVENFGQSSAESTQRIVSVLTPTGNGIDVYLRDRQLHVMLSFTRGQDQTIVLGDNILKRGVWYHFCMKHSKPRLNIFSRDELTIHLDHHLVFQDNIRYPTQLSVLNDVSFAVGTNFDGQISPVYFFAESLSPTIVETLARLDAGKPYDGLSNGLNNVIIDLLPSIVTPDRKTTPIFSKVALSYHPARYTGNYVLDIFSNRHAHMGPVTQAWNITSARDVLNSIGGVSCLLPMFPRLLVDNDTTSGVQISPASGSAGASLLASVSSPSSAPSTPSSSEPGHRPGSFGHAHAHGHASLAINSGSSVSHLGPGAGLGTSWGDAEDTDALDLLEESARQYLLADIEETKNDSCIGLLLTILARCITNHKIYQTELLNMSGIEMIEYALTCVPAEVLQLEGEGCILALTLLRSVVSACAPLETRVIKRLVCNFAIWSRCRYSLQSSLMKVILAEIRKQPAHFLGLVGVYSLLESMHSCYADAVSEGEEGHSEELSSPMRSESSEVPEEKAGTTTIATVSPKIASSSQISHLPVLSLPQEDVVGSAALSPLTPASRGNPGSVLSANSTSSAGAAKKQTTFKNSLQKATREPVIAVGCASSNPTLPAPGFAQGGYIDVIPDPVDAEEDEDQRGRTDSRDLISRSLVLDDIDEQRRAGNSSPHDLPYGVQEERDTAEQAYNHDLHVINYQRKRLRVCLQAMIMALVGHSGHAREIQPLLDFMATSKDLTLINEVAQILLCLLVEGGSKIISAITETCHGAEEFASFVLRYLVHRPREELRCSGIRLITHYYLRVDLLPVTLVTMTLKRRKGGIFQRTMEQVALLSGGQGLQRLSICGGFALLAEVLHCHRRSSSYDTYTALLEMLLTKPGAKSQVTVQYNSLFEEADTPMLSPQRFRDSRDRDDSNTLAGPRTVVFAAHYISPDQVFDEAVVVLNGAVLPVFFNLVPKLRLGSQQEQVFTDLLGLLKNSVGNREAFISCAGWHLCLYSLVSRLMQAQRESTAVLVDTASITAEIGENANPSSNLPPETPAAEKKNISLPPPIDTSFQESNGILDSQADLWFAIGMKIYSTLLLHAVDRKAGGWREVMRTLSLSFDSIAGSASGSGRTTPSRSPRSRTRTRSGTYPETELEVNVGVSFSHAVLSHLLNELTFMMQYKYKDLQRLARSNSTHEKDEANENLKNLLSVIITTAQHSLLEPTVVLGLRGLRVAQLRVQYLAETIQREREGHSENSSAAGTAAADDPESPRASSPRDLALENPDEEYIAELAEETLCRHVDQWAKRYGCGGGGDERMKELDEKSAAKKIELEEESEPLHHHLGDFIEKYDFSHTWVHLGAEEKLDATFSSLASQASHQSESQRRKKFAASERLQPLERTDTAVTGSLVLVLQTLRFFDTVFLPNDNCPVRNVPMLDFYKEPVSAVVSPAEAGEQLSLRPITIFSSAMRMSIFVLQSLSPLTDLATLNIHRMHSLMLTLDRVSPYTTPVYDWMLAVIVHVTWALQRASLALMPAFRLLGITSEMSILTTGISDQCKEDTEEQRVVDEEEIFERALGEAQTAQKVRAIFASVPGAHLLSFVKSCLLLLSDIVEINEAVLGGILDETELGALCSVAARIKADVVREGAEESKLEASFLSTVDSVGSFDSNKSQQESQSPREVLRAGVASTEAERVRSFSEMSMQSVTSDQVWDEARDRTLSSSSITSLTSTGGAHSASAADASAGDVSAGRECLRVMRILRDTYFHTDLLRAVGVVNALSSLEVLERVSVQQHVQELSVFADGLQQQRDFGRGLVEEMTELNNLSASVNKIMVYREQMRGTAKRTEEALNLKNVAAQWEDCMRIFDMDWSPWCPGSSWELSAEGAKAEKDKHWQVEGQFELSKHKDSLMRRMLLTRAPEPIDHSDAAYLEGKQRDQLLFELGLPKDAILPGDVTAPAEPHFSSILKNDLFRPNDKRDLWGEDGEEDGGGEDIMPGKGGLAQGQLNIFGIQSEKRPQWTYAFAWQSDERALLQLEASQITIEKVLLGVLLLTNKFLYFHPRKQTGGLAQESKSYQDQRWHLDRLVEAYGRRYLLQNCAIELLFADAPEVFLAFSSLAELKTFFRTIRRQHVPLLTSPGYLKPKDLIARSPYTDMWRRRLISNFEYLMRLNLLAGRSYNDITQYPVFPWIIADYTSSTLDLTNPATFRDLSKPMGALNPTRLQEIMDRYASMDPSERFMYGSHYSSAGVVLHYMIRQEPFTTLGINLQGGRFDCPDRVFFDIRHTWSGVTTSMSDVKELIPEMFCCPEAFLNTNKLPLGVLQDGGVVDDVVLPPWASDAFEFVRLNREALESDYVSEHLHEWIDLIFGYKQCGEEAIKAHNLFYYLTYENAIDIDAIEDPLQREAAKAQVTHFGQTPSQLLTVPHVKRLPREDCMVPLCSDVSSLDNLVSFTPLKQLGYENSSYGGFGQHGPVIALRCSAERLIAVHADLTVGYYRWHSFPDGEGNPFTLRMERNRRLPSAPLSASVGARPEMPDGGGGVMGRSVRERSMTRGTDGSMSGKSDGSGNGNGVQAGMRNILSFTSTLFSRIGAGGKSGGNISPLPSPDVLEGKDTSDTVDSSITSDSQSFSKTHSAPTPVFSTSAPDDGVSFLEMDSRHVAIGLGDSGLAAIGGIGAGGGRLLSCGYWDHTLKAHGLDTLKELASSSGGHVGPITCLQLGQGTQTIISGGRDGTLRVWVLDGLKEGTSAAFSADGAAGSAGAGEGVGESSGLVCVQSLWGHHSPVQCLSYAPDLDLVLSGSQDGLLCLHTVRKGRFIRSIHDMASKRVDLVLASSPGYMLAHSWTDNSLYLFWINGELLVTVTMPQRIQAMVVNGSGEVVVCGLASGLLSLRALWSLQELRVYDTLHGPVTCLRFAEDHQFLLIGSDDGTFSVMTDPEVRMKMLYSAISKTPLLGTL